MYDPHQLIMSGGRAGVGKITFHHRLETCRFKGREPAHTMPHQKQELLRANPELRFSRLSGFLLRQFRQGGQWRQRRAIGLAKRWEGGDPFSGTLRLMLLERGSFVGAYSYGGLLSPHVLSPNVTIGRYCSFGSGVQIFRRNHPIDYLSTHAAFYNPLFQFVETDGLEFLPLTIEHDVWIGHGGLILPGCHRVGLGAIVGAGAVVTKNVDDFAIVAGNPAKQIGMRFDDALRRDILNSRWWEKSLDELKQYCDILIKPLSGKAPLFIRDLSDQRPPS
jgi:acetyltransferase-like isoleucine patch superfamily enzyme